MSAAGANDDAAGSSGLVRAFRRPRLRTWLLLAIGLWLMLRQVDGVLRELRFQGFGGYVVGDLGPLSPAGLVAQVQALLSVWKANHPLAHAAFATYSVLDTVFIVVYAGLLYSLIRRVGAPTRANDWLIATVVADVAENLLRVVIVVVDSHDPLLVLVYGAWLATSVKWLALATVLVLVLYASREAARAGPSGATGRMLWGVWRLRIPFVLLGAFGMFLIFDPSGQSPDIFRRWFDSGGRFVSALLWTVGATVLLAAVTWTTVRRVVIAGYDVAERGPHIGRWLAAAAVALAVALVNHWENLLSLPIVIVLVIALDAFARKLRVGEGRRPIAHELMQLPARRARIETPDSADELSADERLALLAARPAPHLLPEIQGIARLISVWPLLALLLALVSAWTTPPLVLLAAGEDAGRPIACAIGALVALALSAWLASSLPRRLQVLDARGPPQRSTLRLAGVTIAWPHQLELRHVAAVGACLALCAAAIIAPLRVPPTVGVVGILSVGFGLLIAGLGEAQRYGETHPAPIGLRMAGFDGLPVIALLALAFPIASALDNGDYHDVARTHAGVPPRAGAPLSAAFDGWVARNCANRGTSKRTIPMVFVASWGGGIRATYWTTSVLTTLLDERGASAGDRLCPRATAYDRLFALNGASGGSLGISSYAGRAGVARPPDAGKPWYREAWGATDLASVPTIWGLLVDMPRGLVGWDGPDRARRFEQAVERRDPTLARDFFASQLLARDPRSTPILMHAGTQVESGCRMNMSLVRLTAARREGRPSDCAVLLERPAASARGATPRGSLLPSAPMTSDVLDYVCEGGSLRRSTAALLSARFPYVSPSGRLVRCREGRETPEATAVVDGGYADNTGGQAILDLWARLEPAVAAHNAAGRSRIVPIFVDLDNDYARSNPVGPVARTPQLLVPPLTAGRPDKLDERGVEQLADARFAVDLPGLTGQTCTLKTRGTRRSVHIAPPDSPGIPAPLAWTLSDMAMDDLDNQRRAAFGRGRPAARLRDVLHGTPLRCTRPRR
jgi:hypothetical protein